MKKIQKSVKRTTWVGKKIEKRTCFWQKTKKAKNRKTRYGGGVKKINKILTRTPVSHFTENAKNSLGENAA